MPRRHLTFPTQARPQGGGREPRGARARGRLAPGGRGVPPGGAGADQGTQVRTRLNNIE